MPVKGVERLYFDPTYILVLIGIGLALIAQLMVKSAYRKYLKVPSRRGVPAASVAQALLQQAGALDVAIKPISGQLTDHYDPRDQTLGLSEGVFNSSSVAALAIAAHEAGHAAQKHENYGPFALRGVMVPTVNIGSKLSIPIILLGFAMSVPALITVGIVLFSGVVLFSLVTLPVEFNASARAVRMLNAGGFITPEEEKGVKRVLNAAALTYVAAAASAILQLIRLILLSRGGKRRR